jgi:hypothetical protein
MIAAPHIAPNTCANINTGTFFQGKPRKTASESVTCIWQFRSRIEKKGWIAQQD